MSSGLLFVSVSALFLVLPGAFRSFVMFWDNFFLWSYYGPILDSQSISTLVIVVPAQHQWDCLISAVEYTSKKFCLLENKYFGKMGDSYNNKCFA